MTTIRLHAYKGTNDGSVSCDFRGDKFIGAPQGDQHKTLLEKDVDDNDPLVAEVLEIGPRVDALLSTLAKNAEGPLMGLLGGEVGLRFGVWDKVPQVSG